MILLKALLRERHWQKYATFCKEWDRAADQLDPDLTGSFPSRSQLARWVAGDVRSLPHPDACRILEAMFPGLTAAQLFTSGEGVHVVHATVQSGSLSVTAATATSTSASGDVPSDAIHAERARLTVDGTLSEEIAMSAEEAARFVRRSRGTVDHEVLEQLDDDVRRMAHDYLTKPPFTMFRPLSELRTEVFDRLDERQRPSVLSSLYLVAGRVSALLAHTCADLGQAYAADTHIRSAWLCADLAEDDPLRAYVRWVQSNIAFWNGDYRRAAEQAHSGQRYATSGTGLLRMASQEARAYAAAADHGEAEKALATSQAARSHIGPGDDQPGGVFRFAPGKAAYYASEVRLALGGKENAQKAILEANLALEIFADHPEDGCPEFVAAAQLDLVSAHLELKDLHGAEEHLSPVFSLPAESRTLPVVKRVSAIDGRLGGQQFANAGLAADLRERIQLFRAYTAARELPTLPY